MIKISFTPEFLEWVAQQMRANNTGLDAQEFATEFFHRAFVGRGAEVGASAPLLLKACEATLVFFENLDTDGETHDKALPVPLGEEIEYPRLLAQVRAAIAAARGEAR